MRLVYQVYARAHEGLNRSSDPLELELQTVVTNCRVGAELLTASPAITTQVLPYCHPYSTQQPGMPCNLVQTQATEKDRIYGVWRDGSVTKSTGCSSRGPAFDF